MLRKAIMVTIILGALVFLLWFGSHVLSPLPEEYYRELVYTPIQQAYSEIDFSQPTPEPLRSPRPVNRGKLKQTAWIPDWDFNNGFTSLQNNAQYFDSVSPVWYHTNADGTVKVNRAGLEQLREFTKSHGIKLIPSIASFDGDHMRKILRNPTRLRNHAQFLISEVNTYDLDGIDLDYESFYSEDQPELLELLKILYNDLHPRGKIISFAVHPTWSDARNLYWLTQTRAAQELYELSNYVHELRIMAYNMTAHSSKYAGPVSPADWHEAILRYTTHRVDPRKVMMGMGLYGYDGWSNNQTIPKPYLGMVSNPPAAKAQASAVTYKDVVEVKPRKTEEGIDPSSGEKLLKYTLSGKTYIVFFTDALSVFNNAKVAKRFGINGMAYWRMGGEDQRIYSVVNNL